MKTETQKAKRLENAARIMAGLLASGHYTQKQMEEPWVRKEMWKKSRYPYVIEHTIKLLSDLEDAIDSAVKP